MSGSLHDMLQQELGGLVEPEDTSSSDGDTSLDLEEIEKLAEAMETLASGGEADLGEEEGTPELDIQQLLRQKLAAIPTDEVPEDEDVDDKSDDELRESTMQKIAQLVPGVQSDEDKEKQAKVKSVIESWVAASKEKVATSAPAPSSPRTLSEILGKGGER